MKHETKSVQFTKVRIDEDQGIVDGLITVFGILDEGSDISHPGSFVKTISERAGKIRVCDNHLQDSIMRVLGKPVKLWEVDRAGLPEAVRAKSPEATGGLMGSIQFFLDTPEGKGAFVRIREGGIDEWSYTYDALDVDYSKVKDKNGHTVTARNLKTVRLWEVSPVLWGMNTETAVLGTKSDHEAKPWDVFKVGDKWGVYKVDADGNRTGEALGTHDTEEDANAQIAALHANVDKLAAVHVDTETKNESIEEVANDVQAEFTAVFGDPTAVQPQYAPWVRAPYLDLGFCIVEFGPVCYKVPFTQQDGLVTFAPRDQWVEGTYEFQPLPAETQPDTAMGEYGTMAFTPKGETKVVEPVSDTRPDLDIADIVEFLGLHELTEHKALKAGRVLAQRNVDRIMAAMSALHEALADAGVDMGMTDEHQDAETEMDDTKRDIMKRTKTAPPKSGAGRAGDKPPTDEDLLHLAEVGAAELDLLEE